MILRGTQPLAYQCHFFKASTTTTDNVSQNTVINHPRRLGFRALTLSCAARASSFTSRVTQTRVASNRGGGGGREREKIVSIFRERPSSRVPFCQKRIKRGKRGVFHCSVFDPLYACRFRVNRKKSVRPSIPLEFQPPICLDYRFLVRMKMKQKRWKFLEESSSFLTRSVKARVKVSSSRGEEAKWPAINGKMLADWPIVRSSGWPLTAAKIEATRDISIFHDRFNLVRRFCHSLEAFVNASRYPPSIDSLFHSFLFHSLFLSITTSIFAYFIYSSLGLIFPFPRILEK